MNHTEKHLKHQLNKEAGVAYPDFEEMWGRMEQAGHTAPQMSGRVEAAAPRRSKAWKKVAVMASLSAVLMAVPVYAAVQYDWSGLLKFRGGVQTALEQNLGQPLGQSITRDGVTLKLHTAIVDENRTVILYSFEAGELEEGGFWNIEGMSLTDSKGNTSLSEYNHMQWDEKNKRYNGYFESGWVPPQESATVQFNVGNIRYYTREEVALPLNIGSEAAQNFAVGQDGLQGIGIEVFKESNDKLLVSTAVTFDQPEAKKWAYPQLVAYRNGSLVSELPGGTFGKPGENGEYTGLQYFNPSDLPDEQTEYKLSYVKINRSIDAEGVDLQLSKKQMESGTIKTALDLPLEEEDIRFEQMVITPTQIRVVIRFKDKPHAQLPYTRNLLEVNGRTLEWTGGWDTPKDDPELRILRYERPADLEITKETPIAYIGKYKVTVNEEDKEPLLLTNISDKKQTLIRETGGYPVKWTYYMKGKDLYVETGSDDVNFGGVNQTHIGLGNERILGNKVTVNFRGNGNNKNIDVYKDFKGTEASIYMFYYFINEPDKETRVLLQGK
ncbi:hypothetical protein GCM10010912_24400 [Paenibacillus albidus]|uniref:DUF4179 domain-containing protein n=1 Tax=Paenibacillus albidus TaxID=2041023 RepID=A0A917FGU3_9BACL|nr:DUF4179 domain-containing protein [Paenibacillus albidus]GGF78448.1 hypothetical protein GCM10010912_24400 [Paenibacillus albidus]